MAKRKHVEDEGFLEDLHALVTSYREDGLWVEHIINELEYVLTELREETDLD